MQVRVSQMTRVDPVRKDFLSLSRASSVSDAPLRMLQASCSPSSAPPHHPHLLVHRAEVRMQSSWELKATPSLSLSPPSGGGYGCSGKAESPLPAWAWVTLVVSDFATLWLFWPWDFSGKNTGVGCHVPGDLPNLGIEPVSLTSPALAGGFLYHQCHLVSPFIQPLKKNGGLSLAAGWVDLEGIMQSEISQTEKGRYCMISLTRGI